MFVQQHGDLRTVPLLMLRSRAAPQQLLGVDAGGVSAPIASSLDALWAKLQQQHSQEAEAARLNRRANSEALPTGSQSKANASPAEAEQDVVRQAPGKETVSRTGGGVDVVNERPVARLPTPAREQQMAEADFWKMMQK